MRCARFAATLGFDVEPETLAAIPGALGSFSQVAKERIRVELFKALQAEEAQRCVAIMATTGIAQSLSADFDHEKLQDHDFLEALRAQPAQAHAETPSQTCTAPLFRLAFLTCHGIGSTMNPRLDFIRSLKLSRNEEQCIAT
ncbi:MAG: hypothetical protein MK135_09030, partial [Polyangiaceae bacterium]|nr:hypothetical protein [Polyangiaceae bacterium]